MKIVAYSKVPSATPFVHLGYLSASTTTTKPIQGLLLGGLVLLFVGLSMAGRQLFRRRRLAAMNQAIGSGSSRFGLIKSISLIAGAAAVGCAFLLGERNTVFYDPNMATWDRMTMLSATVANRSKPGGISGSIPRLPTQAGEYNLSSTLNLPANLRKRTTDGWNTPLILRVTQQGGQPTYAVVSAGPDRAWGTQDDITDPSQLKSSF